MSCPHQNTNICLQPLNFRGAAPTSTRPQSFRFLTVVTSTGPQQSPTTKNPKALHQHINDACGTVRHSLPGPSSVRRSTITRVLSCIYSGGRHFEDLFWTVTSSSSSPSIGTTAPCGFGLSNDIHPFSYLPPTLSIFSLPTLEALFLLPPSIHSWVFPLASSLPFLE